MHTALRATSRTLQTYLLHGMADDPDLRVLFDPMLGGTMTISLNTPREMRENNLQGVSLWLYRVERDDQRLNVPPSRPTPNQLVRAPLPMRLHYLVTPFVPIDQANPESSAAREQELLGKVLQMVHQSPIIRGATLTDTLTGSDGQVVVRLESMSLEEITRVWAALQAQYQLSVSFEVTLALITSRSEPERVTPVSSVESQYALKVADGAP
ncbi:hypothetical protein GAU_3444 [Gemmatimonas aurantiaca T-27]|uniref:Pvc16 N-terminal domain-containing protein n=2 Tax=Gemmatimonas aurantiaca TaxID=173480 RepID=C1ADA9_GEMAT|nr:DUF4255 domain-containing protein [Gemmatimonas aurantiaca]BAH40486.1 hypothetical protein GAU_3444 [Gemmatimonas aurantiaca T-27]